MTGLGKFAILLLLLIGVVLEGSNKEIVQFGSIKLRVSLEASPAVLRTAGGSSVYSSGGAVLTNSRWVAIVVSFIPGVTSGKNYNSPRNTAKNTKGIQATKLWIDDVKMRVLVAFPTANPRRANAVYGLFEGVTQFWSVRMDGRRHVAQMFIPPQLVERYAAVTSNGRKEIALAPGDFKVMVEFTTADGKPLGRTCSQAVMGKGNNPYAFFANLLNAPSTVLIKGAVIPKNKSPWAWHMPATFDYIKDSPSGGSAPVKE